MITVKIPHRFTPEIRYTVNCMLKEFIGLSYKEEIIRSKHVILEYNDRQIILTNLFFEGKIEDLYTVKNLPNDIQQNTIEFNGQLFDITSLYGECSINTDSKNIVINFDLIASTFFMLSRWEEGISETFDNLKRFNYKHAISVKYGFYDRPIVNEYIELLKALIDSIGINIHAQKKYKPILSFDIDSISKWKTNKTLIQKIHGYLKNNQFNYIFPSIISFLNVKVLKKNDPSFNFDYISSLLYKYDITNAIFYFKASITDSYYDKNEYDLSSSKLQNVISKLNNNGFIIGLHPSYNTFDNENQVLQEIDLLSQANNQKHIQHSRQHYLRFQVPLTWQILDNANISWDSTMMYSYKAGFRCGICYEFPVFNYDSRLELNLREIPLLLMETNYLNKQSNDQDLIKDVNRITKLVRRYNGINMLLWHNENLDYDDRKFNFEKLLTIVK